MPPCTPWITATDVIECCPVEVTSTSFFDDAAEKASDLMFELSGRIYSGQCSKTVRPCRTNCLCGWQVLSRGHIVGPWDLGYWSPYWYCDGVPCGCQPMSRVKLSGYPVTEVTQVKIDGAALPASDYRLDENRYVTRLDSGQWPGCQNLTLPDTETGTWSITYTYGQDPPLLGVEAAAQLACEIYKACAGDTSCALPVGTVRVQRQGITIEKQSFVSWAFQKETRFTKRGWNTGLSLVDAFLSAANPTGRLRRPIFWAPSMSRRYARPVG